MYTPHIVLTRQTYVVGMAMQAQQLTCLRGWAKQDAASPRHRRRRCTVPARAVHTNDAGEVLLDAVRSGSRDSLSEQVRVRVQITCRC